MKPVIRQIIALFAVMISAISASAYDFELNGICYDITSEENRTVSVTRYSTVLGANISYYKGVISIPKELTYSNNTYTVTSIGSAAFYGCRYITSVEIPNSVTSFEYRAFYGCSGLISISIPNSVTSVGKGAFLGCTALNSISVAENNEEYASKDGVLYNKKISKLLVYPIGCASDRTISLPSTLTSVDNEALSVFTELTAIYLHGDVPPTYNSVFSADILKNTILYIPKGSLAAYEKAAPWRNFWNIEEMEYSGIDDIVAGDAISITVVDGSIIINGIDGATVNVYDISGKLMYSGNGNVVDGLNRGMYIVRIGNIARKVVI